MNPVVLGLGSNAPYNTGVCTVYPVDILKQACVLLSPLFEKGSITYSSIYRTKPMYYESQSDFYNMVLYGLCVLSPEELLEKTQEIEKKLGRSRDNEIRNGPRTVDIDIELFGSLQLKTDTLTIPHEKIREREFVLIPLLEILPEYADPISGVKYSEAVKTLPDQGVKKEVTPFIEL